MSCQREIVAKITDKKADYTIGLKENQRTLYQAVREHFEAVLNEPAVFDRVTTFTTREKGHGRIETRTFMTEYTYCFLLFSVLSPY